MFYKNPPLFLGYALGSYVLQRRCMPGGECEPGTLSISLGEEGQRSQRNFEYFPLGGMEKWKPSPRAQAQLVPSLGRGVWAAAGGTPTANCFVF
ncbi:uncharacterized protein LOC118026365 isoform X3 [Mirounga leonina]|uniref:uncharacterized protein LOC118026365 isoform X3 n=1 Tax=Mirounga leonina TaxID=9715 RepID=UPI00156C2760|nr:uncharacterized protein LOC118026365 isoform X3 [Mirounga leonina]